MRSCEVAIIWSDWFEKVPIFKVLSEFKKHSRYIPEGQFGGRPINKNPKPPSIMKHYPQIPPQKKTVFRPTIGCWLKETGTSLAPKNLWKERATKKQRYVMIYQISFTQGNFNPFLCKYQLTGVIFFMAQMGRTSLDELGWKVQLVSKQKRKWWIVHEDPLHPRSFT